METDRAIEREGEKERSRDRQTELPTLRKRDGDR